MGMRYKDGTSEPKKGDVVLGDKLKGTVDRVLADKVSVRARGAFDPKHPQGGKDVFVERAPEELALLKRA